MMSGVWNLGNHKRMREEEKNLYREIRSFNTSNDPKEENEREQNCDDE